MDFLQKIIEAIELHSAEGIKECFSNGVSPNAYYKKEPLIYELTSEYTRTGRFKDCVRAFVEAGLDFEDKALLAVLSDDAASLNTQLKGDPEALTRSHTLRCAYTPFYKVTLLHICAEFNHLSCAEALLNNGADINVKAGIDEYGFGGQTPIFHTVNQNSNNSIDMLNYLLTKRVDLKLTVTGFVWGKGYEWETLIPSVNPISYSMMGLLPQMHRSEATISRVVCTLLKAAYGIEYIPQNIPCAYLKK